MEDIQNPGEPAVVKVDGVETPAPETNPAPATDPIVKQEEPAKADENAPAPAETVKEMSKEQFEKYNDALIKVSKKVAKADIGARYNAFEDSDVKALVKQQIAAGETLDVDNIASSIVTKLSPVKPEVNNEVAELKAELALMKAGIIPDRLEAAKKLFLAEGGDPSKAAEFAAKYPEWGTQPGDIVFEKAPPLGGKTTPNPDNKPVLTEFQKKVEAARKARGLN